MLEQETSTWWRARCNLWLRTSIQIFDFIKLFKFLTNLWTLSLIRVICCKLKGSHRYAARFPEQSCRLNLGCKWCTARVSDEGGSEAPWIHFCALMPIKKLLTNLMSSHYRCWTPIFNREAPVYCVHQVASRTDALFSGFVFPSLVLWSKLICNILVLEKNQKQKQVWSALKNYFKFPFFPWLKSCSLLLNMKNNDNVSAKCLSWKVMGFLLCFLVMRTRERRGYWLFTRSKSHLVNTK